MGNTNAVKHGERSRQAFFPLAGDDGRFTQLQLLQVRNQLLAERVGELMHRSLSLQRGVIRRVCINQKHH
ncbi:hypothetical protein [Pectobacterium sp. LFLA-215]|uniref:hypothetical protein n=1 Tax=Pectobacterium sp. LFLA-215 TaxID=3419008 RepID=UPI003F5B2E8E